jgi:serine/threonine-protein kinase
MTRSGAAARFLGRRVASWARLRRDVELDCYGNAKNCKAPRTHALTGWMLPAVGSLPERSRTGAKLARIPHPSRRPSLLRRVFRFFPYGQRPWSHQATMSNRIGHYDIVTELGRGGMGVVYKGHEPALNRYVAIKVLSPALAHDEGIKERFLREARSMAALNDPHIIQIYFIGEHDGQPFFAMEFVEGESLSSYLKRDGRMTPEAAARVVYQTAQGLATAHDKNVIHRDIKPANLMLDQKGRIKIADFGIALQSTEFSKKLTSTGEFVGTPGYLSPEVCTGKPVDARSDVFSLGIVLFELLTGRMPFTDESPLGLLLEVVRAEIPDVRELNASVDAGLVAILKKMTAKDPADRYASCHDLVADLAKHPLLAAGNTVSAKPVLSTAASTVIGMKTPLPQAPAYRTEPQAGFETRVTPATNAPSAAVAAQAAASAPPPAARPSVMERQERGARGGGAGWAIAAVLAIGVLGTGWAFRGQLGFGTPPAPPATTTLAAATPPPATAATTPAAAAAVPNPTPATGTPAAADAAQAVQTAAAVLDALGSGQPTPSAGAQAPAATDVGQPAEPIAAAEPAAASEPSHSGIAGVASDTANAGVDAAPDAESLGPLRRMAQARREQVGRAQVAAVERRPEREPVRPAGPPKVAVVAFGDPALTGTARQIVEEELMNEGFLVVDPDLVDGLGGARDLPGAFGILARAANVRAVVVIKADPIGQTQLNYYGQSDTMYSANLSVRAYDVASRSPLNSGSRTKVDFTALNAEYNTREAVEPELRRLVSSLSAYRPRGSGG